MLEKVFEFETVTVNADGTIKDRRRGQANYFTEDLSDGVTMDMVEIPGKTFIMGTAKAEIDQIIKEYLRHGASEELTNEWVKWEMPQHQVTISAFYIGKFEVTQAQWRAVMGTDPSIFKGDDLPVEQVSWNDAMEFCNNLSQKTGRLYRLPSESEWECACRAGMITPFAFGSTITPDLVNYNGNYPYGSAPEGIYREQTTPVGGLGIANAFGLYDMHGNVWEWCEDVWHDSYNGAPTDGSAWMTDGSNQNHRMLRGGSWKHHGVTCRAAGRSNSNSDLRNGRVGFRVAVFGAGTL